MMLNYTVFIYIILFSQAYFYYIKIEKKQNKNSIHQDESMTAIYKGKVWKYITPFLLWTFFSWFQNSADKWILNTQMSSYEVGLYQVLNQYGFQVTSLGVGMLVTLVIPILFEKAGTSNDNKKIAYSIKLNNRIVIIAVVLFSLAFVTTYCFHAFIFKYLAAPEYRSVSYLLPWMVVAGGCFGIGQLLTNNFTISYKPHKILMPKISTAIISILLSWLFVRAWGIKGVIIAVLISQLIYAIWLLFISFKLSNTLLKEV
jgi:O-antigen/teichoic acid export membrane protein